MTLKWLSRDNSLIDCSTEEQEFPRWSGSPSVFQVVTRSVTCYCLIYAFVTLMQVRAIWILSLTHSRNVSYRMPQFSNEREVEFMLISVCFLWFGFSYRLVFCICNVLQSDNICLYSLCIGLLNNGSTLQFETHTITHNKINNLKLRRFSANTSLYNKYNKRFTRKYLIFYHIWNCGIKCCLLWLIIF